MDTFLVRHRDSLEEEKGLPEENPLRGAVSVCSGLGGELLGAQEDLGFRG